MGGSLVVLQDHPVSDYHPAQGKVRHLSEKTSFMLSSFIFVL